jgi:hypothetical protein
VRKQIPDRNGSGPGVADAPRARADIAENVESLVVERESLPDSTSFITAMAVIVFPMLANRNREPG